MAPSTPSNFGVRKRRVASPGVSPAIPHLLRETTISEASSSSGYNEVQYIEHAAPGQDRKTSKKHTTGKCLLDLPPELIDLIASKLRKSAAIFSFARANKRINGILQETIVRDLVLGRHQIKGCLEMLARHPELIQKVFTVDLGDFGCSHHENCTCLGNDDFDADAKELFDKIIIANTGGDVQWSQMRKYKLRKGHLWQKDQAFFLNLLVILCPNIRAVTIELPEARQFRSSEPPPPIHMAPQTFPSLNPELRPVIPFQGLAFQVLRRTLQTLTIAEDTRWKGPMTMESIPSSDHLKWRNMGKHTITLDGFSGLKRLDVPMEALGRPEYVTFTNEDSFFKYINIDVAERLKRLLTYQDWRAQDREEARVKRVPLTLTHLHLRSCNRWTFSLLKKINEIDAKDLNLRYIELFFNVESHQAIIHCDSLDKGRFSYLRLLMELQEKKIDVRFYFGAKQTPVDMRSELEAMRFLTPFELAHFSTYRRPISDLNTEASKRRRSSAIGSRLFLRHARSHFQLMNSATFEPDSWARSAFFHGTKTQAKDHSTRDQKSQGQKSRAIKWITLVQGVWNISRRGPPLLRKILNHRRILLLRNYQF